MFLILLVLLISIICTRTSHHATAKPKRQPMPLWWPAIHLEVKPIFTTDRTLLTPSRLMRTITTKRRTAGRCPIFTTKPTWKVGIKESNVFEIYSFGPMATVNWNPFYFEILQQRICTTWTRGTVGHAPTPAISSQKKPLDLKKFIRWRWSEKYSTVTQN